MECIELFVKKKIISLNFECPKCLSDNSISYEDMLDIYGESCDWKHGLITCSDCGEKFEINNIDWD